MYNFLWFSDFNSKMVAMAYAPSNLIIVIMHIFESYLKKIYLRN